MPLIGNGRREVEYEAAICQRREAVGHAPC